MPTMSSIAAESKLIVSRTDVTIATTCAFLAIAWLAMLLRFWVRAVLIRSVGWDDWAMLFTNVLFTSYCVFNIYLERLAAALLLGEVPLTEYIPMIKYFLAVISLYIVTTVAFKIALGLFFLRIVVRPWQRWTIYGTVAVSTAYGVVYLFLTLFQCGNPDNIGDDRSKTKCLADPVLLGISLTAGIINACSDWILALLPIFVLRETRLPRLAKISAGCVMVLGTLGSVCSVVRLAFIEDFKPAPDFFVKSQDFTIWSLAECCICITAACLATLRPMFRCRSMHGTRGRSAVMAVMPSLGTSHKVKETFDSTSQQLEDAASLFDSSSSSRQQGAFPDFERDLLSDRTLKRGISNSRVIDRMNAMQEATMQDTSRRQSVAKPLPTASALPVPREEYQMDPISEEPKHSQALQAQSESQHDKPTSPAVYKMDSVSGRRHQHRKYEQAQSAQGRDRSKSPAVYQLDPATASWRRKRSPSEPSQPSPRPKQTTSAATYRMESSLRILKRSPSEPSRPFSRRPERSMSPVSSRMSLGPQIPTRSGSKRARKLVIYENPSSYYDTNWGSDEGAVEGMKYSPTIRQWV